MRALESCDVIAGYGVYVDLVKPLLPDKEYLVTPMRKEGGPLPHGYRLCAFRQDHRHDSPAAMRVVYGMAGLIHELAEGKDLEIEVIPGVTAALRRRRGTGCAPDP